MGKTTKTDSDRLYGELLAEALPKVIEDSDRR